MSKNKERSEVEYLRSENRKLKSQVKHLKKDISRKTKREFIYTDLQEREAELLLKEQTEDNKLLKSNVCPTCSRELEVINLGVKKLYVCDNCKYRTTKKS